MTIFELGIRMGFGRLSGGLTGGPLQTVSFLSDRWSQSHQKSKLVVPKLVVPSKQTLQRTVESTVCRLKKGFSKSMVLKL